jgi:hypothetical protein
VRRGVNVGRAEREEGGMFPARSSAAVPRFHLSLRALALTGDPRVGGGIAPPAPHGSGRAELPHPALRDTGSLRGVQAAPKVCTRQLKALQQATHPLPRHPSPLRAAL